VVRRLVVLACIGLLAACAGPVPGPDPKPTADTASDWHPVALPGKESTRYSLAHKDGRAAIEAVSERSASLWRRNIRVPAAALGEVSFSWWVPFLMPTADVAAVDHTDASARVMFGFSGDVSALPMRTRMMFDLAEALTGERPPYATLVYVWDVSAPVGSVIINPRSDRIRKIVVDSGPAHLSRWRDHRRNLRDDYRLAFGEEPGALQSIALMTDSDNTRSRSQAWYGPVQLH
jgi:hypothetical protein